jgi:probable phosphoglycerate mutase
MPLPQASVEPRRLVLWRHGRTEWNAVGRAQGHADVSLDEVGRAQVARAAPLLASYEPAFVWSSDSARARETAEPLAALTGHACRLDRRLREYDVGARQGMTSGEFREAFPDVFARHLDGEDDIRVPGAEARADVQTRMLEVMSEAAAAVEPGQTGVLVGHGASLRTGLLAFFGIPMQSRKMLAGMANCAWTVLRQHHYHGWQIVDYNAQTLPEPIDLADDPSYH